MKTNDWLPLLDMPFTAPPIEDLRIYMGRYRPNAIEESRGWYGPPIDALPYGRRMPHMPRCGKGKGCMQIAGFGTQHYGTGPCRYHGGNSKKYMIQWVREFVEEQRQKGLYGDPQDVSPDEALLDEVHRTAGHVAWLQAEIQTLGQKKQAAGQDPTKVLYQFTEAAGIGASGLLTAYREERAHLVRVSKAAIDAGVSQRRVEIQQTQAQMLAHVMVALITDKELGLEYTQQMAARKLMRKHLEQMPTEVDALPAVIETEIVE